MPELPYQMTRPCKFCDTYEGILKPRSGQNCVYCAQCGRLVYNAPKTETGEKRRSTTTIHNGIKPSLRAKIIQRDSARCVLCGRTSLETFLNVDHILDVKLGLENDLTETELNSEENLVTLCEECNLGKGASSFPLRLLLIILRRRANGQT